MFKATCPNENLRALEGVPWKQGCPKDVHEHTSLSREPGFSCPKEEKVKCLVFWQQLTASGFSSMCAHEDLTSRSYSLALSMLT